MLLGATIRIVLQVFIGNFKLRHLPSTNKMIRCRNKTMGHTIWLLGILIRNNTKLQIRSRGRFLGYAAKRPI